MAIISSSILPIYPASPKFRYSNYTFIRPLDIVPQVKKCCPSLTLLDSLLSVLYFD